MIGAWWMAPLVVVGLLTEQGDPTCKDGVRGWANDRYEVGFQPVDFEKKPSAELIGKPVVFSGIVTPSPRGAPLVNDGSCPPMQMRSDWVESKGGFRIKRDGQPGAQHWSSDKAEAFAGLTASVVEGELVVQLVNTLGVPLTDVVLHVHYEGCYGKPGSAAEHRPLGALAAGKSASAAFPLRVTRKMPRGSEHVPFSIRVTGKGAVIDLDVPVGVLGLKVPCTDRK